MKPPCETCRGLCCYHAPFDERAWERVKHLAPEGTEVTEIGLGSRAHGFIPSAPGTNGRCAFLQDGRCSIYTRRPKVCRAMGTLQLPCPVLDPAGASAVVSKLHRVIEKIKES